MKLKKYLCHCCSKKVVAACYRLKDAKRQMCYDLLVDEIRYDCEVHGHENLPHL